MPCGTLPTFCWRIPRPLITAPLRSWLAPRSPASFTPPPICSVRLNPFRERTMRESKAFQEIRAEGMVDAKCADISERIALRFGDDAVAEFRDILLGIRDVDSNLHRLAIQSQRLADLRRAFAA